MTQVAVHNLDGKKMDDLTLDEAVFGMPENDALLHQVYVAQAANRRSGSAHTKIRSERRGGGKKPWKQKGTGNARTGSIRNPIWRGGGIIFGPRKERNYTKEINTKMKQKAVAVALSAKIRDGKMIVVDSLQLPEQKTKAFAQALKNLGIERSVFVGFAPEEAPSYKALRNIPKTTGRPTEQISVYDLLNTDVVLLSKDSIKQIEEKYKKD